MKTSDSLNELITDLIAFQNEMPVLRKDSTVSMELKSGRKVQYDYIELGAIVQQSKEVLSKHNLSVIQPRSSIDGKPVLFTMLMHKSGQYIQTHTFLDLTGKTEQEKGSAITYNSRYDYVGMLRFGLLDEDDDGQAASKSKPAQIAAIKKENKPVGETIDAIRKVQATLEDPGQFVYAFGKFTGKKLCEMNTEDIDKNVDFWETEKKKGSISPLATDFLINAYKYMEKIGQYPPEGI